MYIEITNVEIWIKVHTVLWLPKLAVCGIKHMYQLDLRN